MDEPEDLDHLVDELHATASSARPRQLSRMEDWLAVVTERNASDLLLVAGVPACVRVDGRVQALAEAPLDGGEIEDAVLPILPAHAGRRYRELQAADASLRFKGRRFRVNLHRERGRAAAAIRALPPDVPRLAGLNLPPEVDLLSRVPRGLVLIGGATGSGKTTTLAAIVDAINRREARHIVTIEDPIEYEHQHQASVVEQLEVGIDTPDFPTALRAAVRQVPDVIVIGEMRDPETMHIALNAAETGHLVLSTIHAMDVASAISRIGDSFPPERQNTIRQELAMALAAVMTQALLPRAGGGVVPAAEVLVFSYGARQHVRKNALQHLHQEITITRKIGSLAFEDSLGRLVREGRLDRSEARLAARHPEELDQILAGAT